MSVLAVSGLLAEGESLLAARHLPEAAKLLQQAHKEGADADRCAAGLWMTYMLSGQFESAWLESDAIRQRGARDSNRFWQGESLVGKHLIVRCLHGFGDATQFLRYAPRLRAITSSLVVEVPPRFVELASCFDGVDEVITWDGRAGSCYPPWDTQVEIMELPYIFRTQLDDLPLATKYLHLPRSSPVSQATHLGRLRVGLAWSAGSWNQARSVDLEALLPILATGGCEFWNLEGRQEEVQRTNSIALHLHEEASCRDSIMGLAEAISQLDLIITVDTLAAHLAGALGVSAWVLLQHESDWRWMHDRDDCPWYPSLKLFRQPSSGDWNGAIAAVCDALRYEVSLRDLKEVNQ